MRVKRREERGERRERRGARREERGERGEEREERGARARAFCPQLLRAGAAFRVSRDGVVSAYLSICGCVSLKKNSEEAPKQNACHAMPCTSLSSVHFEA